MPRGLQPRIQGFRGFLRQSLHPSGWDTRFLRAFSGVSWGSAESLLAHRWLRTGRMAAVFARVFLPVIAAVGFMARADGIIDVRTAMALAVFIPMAFGVFYGALRMSKQWEEQTD